MASPRSAPPKARHTRSHARRALAGATLFSMLTLSIGSGCAGSIDRMTLKKVAPGVLKMQDLGMVCGLGETLTSLLKSLFGKQPDKAVLLAQISAALCNEERAWSIELERRRAVYASGSGQDTATWAALAADLAQAEAREHAMAARRHVGVWEIAKAEFELNEDEHSCGKLKEEEEIVYLLGMTAGLLAVVHDASAERSVGVSFSVARTVARAVKCLDNERLWGVPNAIEAAVYIAIPGSAPEGVDPWAQIAAAAEQGDAAGMWLPRGLEALSTAAAGGDVRPVLKKFAAANEAVEARSDVALLNEFARRLALHESDRIWVDETGARTPLGGLGTFPGALGAGDAEGPNSAADDAAMDDLLDAELEGDTPPAACEPGPEAVCSDSADTAGPGTAPPAQDQDAAGADPKSAATLPFP